MRGKEVATMPGSNIAHAANRSSAIHGPRALTPLLVGSIALAMSVLAIGATPTLACEAVHIIQRFGNGAPVPAPPPFTICWGGPCANKLGTTDNLGRIKIVKSGSDFVIDFIFMSMMNPGNPGHDQVLVSAQSNPVCSPPAGTVAGCTQRFKVPHILACPLGGAPCANNQKITVTLDSIDQINAVTTGGSITLADGQVVQGRVDNNFWLHFQVCCPDLGQFGVPGDSLNQVTTITEVMGNDPATCNTRTPNTNNPTEVIPPTTFPCS
jgi:hypothetical protein